MLEGKKLLITGVVNRESIAYEVARQAQEAGAEVVLTGSAASAHDRAVAAGCRAARRARARRQQPETSRRRDELRERWGRVDGILHAIAFAPEDALGGNFLTRRRERRDGVPDQRVLAEGARRRARRPVPRGGRGVVGLDFDASVAWPVYDWMGVAKAALEATSRYLARDLGPRGVRVNLVSAGPLGTLAARGIPGFGDLADGLAAPGAARLGHRRPGAGRRRRSCSCSATWRAAITGEILHVDGGFHAMGTALGAASMPRRRPHEAARLPHRRDRLPRHGGARAAARGRRPRGRRARARAPTTPPPRSASTACSPTLWRDPSPLPRPRARRRRRRHARRPRASTPAERTALAEDVGAVLHCAASISFDLPLDEARAINVEGTREVIGFARECKALGRLERFVHVSTAYVSGKLRGHVPRAPARRGPGVPQHLRADQVGGRAHRARGRPTWRPRSPGRASSWASPTPAGRRPSTSSTGRCARSRAGCSTRSRRCRRPTSTSCRSTTWPTRSCTCSTSPTQGVFNLVAGREAPFANELVELALRPLRPAAARGRARAAGPTTTSTARSTCRTSTWRSCSTTRAPARCSARPASARRGSTEYFGTLIDYAEEARWGKRAMTREEARERFSREPAAA